MSVVAPLRWGISSTGWISSKFALDLLIDPATRDSAAAHEIVAVGSRSLEAAHKFVGEFLGGKDNISCHGTYAALYADKRVEAIYIGSPHSHHYEHAHAALSAGKHVLCEKSLTVNALQAQALFELARSKKLFLMEAVWTRFQPIMYKVQEVVRSGTLGALKSVSADLSIDFEPHKLDPGHRMVDMNLAGGALLDLGPYPWVQLALILLPEPSASSVPHTIPKIAASVTKFASGADLESVAIIQFPQPDGRIVHGTMSCSMERRTVERRAVVIECEKGHIEIAWPAYRPEFFTATAFESIAAMQDSLAPVSVQTYDFSKRPGGMWGFGWEADEVFRCIRAGKIESERMPWRDTVLMMQVFDEIRSQGGLVYPERIETLELQ